MMGALRLAGRHFQPPTLPNALHPLIAHPPNPPEDVAVGYKTNREWDVRCGWLFGAFLLGAGLAGAVTARGSWGILPIRNHVPKPEQAGSPMKIDIDRLSEAELIDLNNRIVARLRFLNQMRAHSDMLEFRIGDRVAFQPPEQGQVEGMLTRYNKKTVTVITDDGRQWNVSPNFLSKIVSAESASPGGSNVVLLGKR
jgi:hypothetical protein